jgi:hypothetical protein
METIKTNQLIQFQDLLLETLSFYEPMTISKMIFDFDEKKIREFRQLEQSDLMNCLKKLERAKKIKKVKIGTEDAWMRVLTRRPWWKRIFV